MFHRILFRLTDKLRSDVCISIAVPYAVHSYVDIETSVVRLNLQELQE